MIPCGHTPYAREMCHCGSFNDFKGEKNETDQIGNIGFRNLQSPLPIFPTDGDSELNETSPIYFDNIKAYFTHLDNAIHLNHISTKKPIYGYIEIFVSIFILPSINFFKANFHFFIIKNLGLFHLLLPEVIYKLTKDTLIFILKIINDLIEKTQIIQFIIISIGNIFTFIGVSIYLELIEIKFCGFDKDTKKI